MKRIVAILVAAMLLVAPAFAASQNVFTQYSPAQLREMRDMIRKALDNHSIENVEAVAQEFIPLMFLLGHNLTITSIEKNNKVVYNEVKIRFSDSQYPDLREDGIVLEAYDDMGYSFRIDIDLQETYIRDAAACLLVALSRCEGTDDFLNLEEAQNDISKYVAESLINIKHGQSADSAVRYTYSFYLSEGNENLAPAFAFYFH